MSELNVKIWHHRTGSIDGSKNRVSDDDMKQPHAFAEQLPPCLASPKRFFPRLT